ncbi:asparagine synthase (glutamine-hydrolyzing) [Lutibacter citreus]|uniref:asparagine synthase (glutamine-hydrolyzing) n=1 Tax=Lutibacter citreus TaxID=2138210 RepID=UPI000DBE020F|nr:asparagine synthase (glutamine-hydrolyzing) [Lutibacter citreus]
MCGIVGFLANGTLNYKSILSSMVTEIKHRGPDSKGIWFNNSCNIGLGHARLSIIDLTENGSQPMHSDSERYTIIFNGEIYNHLAIRKELELNTSISWKGTSDTETLLKAIEIWGLDKTIENCIGMFAFALWDATEENLTLVRDRMGEKPIYYGWVNGNFVFASELKPIQSFPLFNNAINRNALALFLKHCAIPEPYSIYENIFKLEAGFTLTINAKTKKINKSQYWSIEDLANSNNQPSFKGSSKQAVENLEELLLNAISLQMQADVPLGAFLSGGVDSSVVVALMQKQSDKKVNTFSIGFNQKEYNEAEHAKKVANHIGTDHHEAYITSKEVLDIVPLLPKIYTEPFSEASQIPTYLVSKMAKNKVTVSLSGDGGDELFCGYSRYQLASKSWNSSSKIPYFLRQGMFKGITNLPIGFLELLVKPLKGKVDKNAKEINFVDKILKAAPLLNINNRNEFYQKGFMTHNLNATDWVLGSEASETLFQKNNLKLDSFFAEMMAVDLMTYLPNNNLTKVDRAGMSNSLETRVPLLDHRIVEFAMSLPIEYKLRNGIDKWVLREVLYKYVPKQLIERPKMGFGVPLGEWLRGPLKEWCENLLDEKRLKEEGFFNAQIIRSKWKEHLSRKRNWEVQLWDVIVFQDWLDNQKDN